MNGRSVTDWTRLDSINLSVELGRKKVDETLSKRELRVQTKSVEEAKTFLDNLLLFTCDALTKSGRGTANCLR